MAKILWEKRNDIFDIYHSFSRSYLLEELHETKSVAVLFRDTHANNIGRSSNQSSISFKQTAELNNTAIHLYKD